MNCASDAPGYTAVTADLHAAIEHVLTDFFGAPRRLAGLSRRRSEYQSSFPLEELELQLESGDELTLIFKDLSPQARLANPRRVKPLFLYHPQREIEVYLTVLSELAVGPACYGAVVEPAADRYWLFLEKAPGVELYQIGEIAVWRQVARWLAGLHRRTVGRAQSHRCQPHLLVHDRAYYWRWLERAQEAVQRLPPADRQSVAKIAARYDRVVQQLLTLPASLIHGEFYASNVLVQRAGDAVDVCPVDWETAAIGPGLIDLAALTAGGWTDEQRRAIAISYHAELRRDADGRPTEEMFLEALDYCRLHLAVQWLGWSRDWSPPADHAQDWLGEAVRISARLGLI